jgi:cellulose synthase/poly-beta-1,6-N-acetylglucosamine synthase-like glycosyltransferase/peptidoglycan/xylan/chitin deacetylase (PgdA/CDA1 family)
VWLLLAVVVTVLTGGLILSIFVNPILPHLELRSASFLPHPPDLKPKLPKLVVTRRQQKAQRAEEELKHAIKAKTAAQNKSKLAHSSGASQSTFNTTTNPLRVGFFVNSDDSSYSSLKRNIGQLDWVVPVWLYLQDGADPLFREIDQNALDLMRRERPDLRIVPLIQNFKGGNWDSDLLARNIGDQPSRDRLIAALKKFVDDNKFGGISIDFEEVPEHSLRDLLQFMQQLHAAFAPSGLVVTQAAPFDNPDWDYAAFGRASDYLMLMAYDEHWAASGAGPIAGQEWYERMLRQRMTELDPDRTIVCLGAYGYNWSDQGTEAEALTFQEAMLAARDSDATVAFDPASRNPNFSYDEDDGSHHQVWMLDAVTVHNQMLAANAYQPAGFALWRLGAEDPSVWNVFGAHNPIDSLRQIQYGYDVDFEGTGEILQVAAEPHDGAREIDSDPATGFIRSEKYTNIPSSYVIKRGGDRPGLVALTFDDGPDAVWTPRILDLLKKENVPATFFVIGDAAQLHPDLVRRIINDGHDIGNHTFTHPNLGEIPERLTILELNATQRLIEAITGRSTVLFRPPYFGDAEPTTPDEVMPVTRAERLGYLTVGLHVDPNDWAMPGTDEIVKQTIAGVENPDPDKHGQVVLLHDGGGDRAQTLAALPQIITELRARGYRFVTVSELAGLTRDQTMPVLPKEFTYTSVDGITFFALGVGSWILHWLFLLGIVLGAGRLLFIGVLALAQWLRSRKRAAHLPSADYQPWVSVIVPAYNEERVIAQTIRSLLASTYAHSEIIVVDDGSTDGTCEVVRKHWAGDSRVLLLTKENAGKAEALNFGIRHARGEIIIGLDADTIFEPATIEALARRFHDERLGALAGNAKVGNRINIVTRWQALEYITSQNLDRRAFASLNCITVVPGAVGAWRRDLIEKAGGFTADTLAEDQDLTLRVRRLGYNIGYEESAVAWTEAPDTLRGLDKQRFRWSFGTLQCMWKHRDALFRWRYGTLGFIGMPNVWLFQILFPLVSPLMDLMLVWALLSAAFERVEHAQQVSNASLRQVLFYYAFFLAIDWLASAFAFVLERHERWSLLWWLFLQRFGYRQIMYYVMLKSVRAASQGALVGWGKLDRKATVEAEV